MSPERDGPVTSTTLVGGPAGQRSAMAAEHVAGRPPRCRAPARTNTATRGSRLTKRPGRAVSTTIAAGGGDGRRRLDHADRRRGRRLQPTPGPLQRVPAPATSRSKRWSTRTGPRPAMAAATAARRRPRWSGGHDRPGPRRPRPAFGHRRRGRRRPGRRHVRRARRGWRAGGGAGAPSRWRQRGPGRSPEDSPPRSVTAAPGPRPQAPAQPGSRRRSPARATRRPTRPAADVAANPARVLHAHDHASNPEPADRATRRAAASRRRSSSRRSCSGMRTGQASQHAPHSVEASASSRAWVVVRLQQRA